MFKVAYLILLKNVCKIYFIIIIFITIIIIIITLFISKFFFKCSLI